jgi:hypothetical protein
MAKNKVGPTIKAPKIKKAPKEKRPPGRPARRDAPVGGSIVVPTYKKFGYNSVVNGDK